jgi:hypothetical protein
MPRHTDVPLGLFAGVTMTFQSDIDYNWLLASTDTDLKKSKERPLSRLTSHLRLGMKFKCVLLPSGQRI